jgi:hypothetical protein
VPRLPCLLLLGLGWWLGMEVAGATTADHRRGTEARIQPCLRAARFFPWWASLEITVPADSTHYADPRTKRLGFPAVLLPQPKPQLTINPSTIPNRSWMTLARGARQLVVQDALLKQPRCARTQ